MLRSSAKAIRPFSTSVPRLFLGNFFGTKEAKKKEIIQNQDDYEVDPTSKIVILSEENSPEYKPFVAEEAMPDFKINQWKFTQVNPEDIEASYSNETLTQVISQSYSELKGEQINENQYKDISLTDLQFRFQLGKLLQQKLGFDIKDHTLTRAHTLEYLHNELNKVISHRWSSERNPNAVVLRPEDFELVLNVYLSNERTQEEQKKAFEELVEKAKEATAL
ncbi:CIC11C00000001917 [Sungouiella intermedia]|uniref:Large ribosomal subunit protein mL50 n=1 Tax=Sungouiella intermedia TaxID=45354 RepID=A0A1L0BUB2_9ASCO|nr:CIC11C00000001917 [[Candida] intermedia]